MDQTVNLTSPTSVVRIYLFPPRQRVVKTAVFSLFLRSLFVFYRKTTSSLSFVKFSKTQLFPNFLTPNCCPPLLSAAVLRRLFCEKRADQNRSCRRKITSRRILPCPLPPQRIVPPLPSLCVVRNGADFPEIPAGKSHPAEKGRTLPLTAAVRLLFRPDPSRTAAALSDLYRLFSQTGAPPMDDDDAARLRLCLLSAARRTPHPAPACKRAHRLPKN